MKAPAFHYARPDTLDEALALLAAQGEGATILAGGQSLLAMLNLRLTQPELLIDINRIAGLGDITDQGGHIRIGALARHAEVIASPLVVQHLPLVALAMPYVAHLAVRNRGTFGGSIALADPAAELPACAVALGATMVLCSLRGERRVAAEDFFNGLYSTARAADELLVAVDLPKRPACRVAFRELSRRHGDFAMVGAAACHEAGSLRLVVFGCESHARLAVHAAAAAQGRDLADEGVRNAVAAALDADLEPSGTLSGRPDTKRELARVLVRRALADLAA